MESEFLKWLFIQSPAIVICVGFCAWLASRLQKTVDKNSDEVSRNTKSIYQLVRSINTLTLSIPEISNRTKKACDDLNREVDLEDRDSK